MTSIIEYYSIHNIISSSYKSDVISIQNKLISLTRLGAV